MKRRLALHGNSALYKQGGGNLSALFATGEKVNLTFPRATLSFGNNDGPSKADNAISEIARWFSDSLRFMRRGSAEYKSPWVNKAGTVIVLLALGTNASGAGLRPSPEKAR